MLLFITCHERGHKDIRDTSRFYGAYATDATCFKPACKEAAGGGVASIAPGRASKENKPFRAQFDAAREAWRKQGIERWASKTSDNCRQNLPDVSDAHWQ